MAAQRGSCLMFRLIRRVVEAEELIGTPFTLHESLQGTRQKSARHSGSCCRIREEPGCAYLVSTAVPYTCVQARENRMKYWK